MEKATPPTPWYVLYVRPRCEKKVASLCSLARIVHYLPLRQRKGRYQRTERTFLLPLFPGYLFARLDPGERRELEMSGNILRFLRAANKMRLLRQLVQVRRALRANPDLICAAKLEKGQWVRVTRGPLKGIQGMVSSLRSPSRIFLDVEMMDQAAVLQVSKEELEII